MANINSKLLICLAILLLVFAGIFAYTKIKLTTDAVSSSEDSLDQLTVLPFETILKGVGRLPSSFLAFEDIPEGRVKLPLHFSTSGVGDRRAIYVINNSSEWSNFLDIFVSEISRELKIEPFNINFNDEMIVVAFRGYKHLNLGKGIHDMEIIMIVEKGNSVEVVVREMSPPPSDIALAAAKLDYHIIKVEKVDKEVVYYKIRQMEPSFSPSPSPLPYSLPFSLPKNHEFK